MPLARTVNLCGIHGGRTLAATLTWCKYMVEVFTVEKGKLVRRLRSPIDPVLAYAVGDRYFVKAKTEQWFELTA